jgi:hypothetical protein
MLIAILFPFVAAGYGCKSCNDDATTTTTYNNNYYEDNNWGGRSLWESDSWGGETGTIISHHPPVLPLLLLESAFFF